MFFFFQTAFTTHDDNNTMVSVQTWNELKINLFACLPVRLCVKPMYVDNNNNITHIVLGQFIAGRARGPG